MTTSDGKFYLAQRGPGLKTEFNHGGVAEFEDRMSEHGHATAGSPDGIFLGQRDPELAVERVLSQLKFTLWRSSAFGDVLERAGVGINHAAWHLAGLPNSGLSDREARAAFNDALLKLSQMAIGQGGRYEGPSGRWRVFCFTR